MDLSYDKKIQYSDLNQVIHYHCWDNAYQLPLLGILDYFSLIYS